MKRINFTKMVASGNDFVVAKLKVQSFRQRRTSLRLAKLKVLAKNICDRKFGVGADGLLILEESKVADIKMRIFNPDGSEAQMCGNGARCVALWLSKNRKPKTENLNIETKAGIIEFEVKGDNIKIKLTEPQDIKLDIPIKINNRHLKVNFINTGVPHVVVFVQGLDKIDTVNIGRSIRYYKKFAPRGTNVDFVEVLNKNSVKIRTYERGVEDETLACGTGAVAAALITDYRLPITDYRRINVYTRGREILKVYFSRQGNNFHDIWLAGQAKIVYKGVYYV